MLYENPSKSMSMAINIAKQIYATCMNATNKHDNNTLLKKVEEFGRWPAVHGDDWNEREFNLSNLLSKISKNRFFSFLYLLYPIYSNRQTERDEMK